MMQQLQNQVSKPVQRQNLVLQGDSIFLNLKPISLTNDTTMLEQLRKLASLGDHILLLSSSKFRLDSLTNHMQIFTDSVKIIQRPHVYLDNNKVRYTTKVDSLDTRLNFDSQWRVLDDSVSIRGLTNTAIYTDSLGRRFILKIHP
jgi:hypothetical protein